MDIVQTAVVLGFGLALVIKLDELITERPDFKKGMVSTIINFPNAKCSDIIKKSNEIFLQLFNLIYENKLMYKNLYSWKWIIYSFSVSLFTGLTLYSLRIIIPLEKLLVYLLMIPSAYVIIGIYSKENRFLNSFSMVFFSVITIVFLGFNPMNSTSYPLSIIIFVFPLSISIGISFINFFIKRRVSFLFFSPPRVIFTSILTITIIALIKKDIFTSFISDYNEIGIIVLGYLFLNVFADSISLLETDIVLRLAAKGNIKKFAALGLFDILLSAVIFLVIPLSTGNLDVFLDAMLFKGDHPWLGVLFWSTFSTSIIFWLFLLSVFVLTILQKILKYYVKLNVALPIDKKPITCLYVTAVVFIIPFMLL